MEKLDKKFHIGVVHHEMSGQGSEPALLKVKDGTDVPDDQWVVFLAKDTAFFNILPLYLEECARLGADAEQLRATGLLLANVIKWREANPNECKVPDAAGERMLR